MTENLHYERSTAWATSRVVFWMASISWCFSLKECMDDDAVEGARAVFKDLFKVDAECRDISGVVGRITQYLDLLEQATAFGQHRKREILVDLHLGPTSRDLWDWLTPMIRERSAVGRTFHGFPPALQNICRARFAMADRKSGV